MIWRQAQLPEEVSPTNDPNINLILTVGYEEKDSWNPMNGTTDKRNYKSKIKLMKNGPTGGKPLKEWDLPSWSLGDGIFYHTGSSTLFVLYGKDDEYGTLNQTLSLYPETGGAFSYPATPEKRIIFQMAPSPNGNLVALVTASPTAEGEFSEFELNLIQLSDKKIQSFPINFWTALPLYGIRWAEDGTKLYLRTPDRILVWSGKEIQETKSFPDCFTVSTNFGKWAYESASIGEGGNVVLGKKLPAPRQISNIDKIKLCR
ncbi:hypothetical protein [Leptospira terpstrae]|uniref:WD40-like protein n=1 Tax=Leptospira terpstrae serovar Hualin str. LT 11-33 = ATCC 700639 TaxID=1257025 RepID=N1W3K3_9LEPT|nr:hypothetical protein [Leptospira terpstrae]EMY62266.1 hypothetical protein LEP1GSC203_2348 [Leptospira terpstrae serovar Hualin str. LT 11-33 = ATCC 700639]